MAGSFLVLLICVAVSSAVQMADVSHRVLKAWSSSMRGGDLPDATATQLPKVRALSGLGADVDAGLGSRMGELETSLAELRQHHKAAVNSLRAKFEANLTTLERENRMSEHEISELAVEIRNLEVAIRKRRELARKLQRSNELIRKDIIKAKVNVSTAADFAANVLNITYESLNSTPELVVLAEINEEDAADKKAKERVQRLAEVRAAAKDAVLLQMNTDERSKNGKGRMSAHATKLAKKSNAKIKPNTKPAKALALMALHNETKTKEAPKDILSELLSNLDGLAEEQNASEASFTATFEKEYETLLSRHQVLFTERDQLNATKTKNLEINHKVATAVEHLNKTNQDLQSLRGSLLAFIRRFASQEDAALSKGTKAKDSFPLGRAAAISLLSEISKLSR